MLYFLRCIRLGGYNRGENFMDEVYCLVKILDDYCRLHNDNEDIFNISYLVKIILNKIDKINSNKR